MKDAEVTALIAAVLLAGKFTDDSNDAVMHAEELITFAQQRLDNVTHARIAFARQQAAAMDEEEK